MQSSIAPYLQLIRFERPIGTLLLLWPTLTALWLARGAVPDVSLILIFSLGAFLMRSVGCILNDIADRNFDGHVERTCQRPLAIKVVTVKQAAIFALTLSLLAFMLVCFTNQKTIGLSVIAIVLAAVYPWMKRIMNWPQLVLGMAFAWAIPMAFAASNQPLTVICWLLYLATVLWPLAYDTLYAVVDREDDLKIGIRSTAIRVAPYENHFVFICHVGVLGCYALIAVLQPLSVVFWIGWLIAFGHCLLQQFRIRKKIPSEYFRAFLSNNTFGAILFGSVVLALL